jgi:hypothetical protein
MMLKRRGNKKVTMIALVATVAVHSILFVIFREDIIVMIKPQPSDIVIPPDIPPKPPVPPKVPILDKGALKMQELYKTAVNMPVEDEKLFDFKISDFGATGGESGYYIYQIDSDLCRKTGAIKVSRLRRLPNRIHPVFSSKFNLDEVPTAEASSSDELPYGERGVFGVEIKGRLAICYTEGYKEKEWLKNLGTRDSRQEAALKWVTNVVVMALAEGSLAR